MSSMGIEAIGSATSALSGLGSLSSTDSTLATDQAQSTTATSGSSSDFGNLLIQSIDGVEALGDKASDLSVKAATGDLDSLHDYTIAATEAQVATQLTVAVRDKAVAAFNEIMRMSV